MDSKRRSTSNVEDKPEANTKDLKEKTSGFVVTIKNLFAHRRSSELSLKNLDAETGSSRKADGGVYSKGKAPAASPSPKSAPANSDLPLFVFESREDIISPNDVFQNIMDNAIIDDPLRANVNGFGVMVSAPIPISPKREVRIAISRLAGSPLRTPAPLRRFQKKDPSGSDVRRELVVRRDSESASESTPGSVRRTAWRHEDSAEEFQFHMDPVPVTPEQKQGIPITPEITPEPDFLSRRRLNEVHQGESEFKLSGKNGRREFQNLDEFMEKSSLNSAVSLNSSHILDFTVSPISESLKNGAENDSFN